MNLGIDLVLLLVALAAVVLFFVVRLSRRGVDETGAPTRGFEFDGSLRRAARQAGFEPRRFYPLFGLACAISTFAVPLATLEFLPQRFQPLPGGVLAALFVLGFALPWSWLWSVRRERQSKIHWSLAYFLDLIVAYLRSGLGLEEAFRRAGREGFPPDHPLAQEVALVSREIDLGKDRPAAFRALYARTGVLAMKGIAAALESGLRLGASVEATLRAQAELLRARRREDTLRRVQLAAVKALVPVMLCGFPVFLVIVLYPAVSELARTLGYLTWWQ